MPTMKLSRRDAAPDGRMPLMDHLRELRNRLIKAILAFVPPQWQRMHTPLEMTAMTPATITDWDAFAAELATTTARGWARELCEDDAHTVGVAAPVLDRTDRAIVAITVVGPANRIDEHLQSELGAALVETAGAISRELGVATV